MSETKQQTPPSSSNNPRPLPPLVSIGEFLKGPCILPADLVPGVLHKEGKLALGGGSKSFKTWNLACLACALATGTDWLNWRCIKSRVLIVNFEIHRGFFRKRLEAIRDAQHLEFDPDSVQIWNLRGFSGGYAQILPELAKKVKETDSEVAIIDPLYKLYGDTDENSASSVALLLNEVEKLTVDTGIGCVFGSHYSKGNQASKEAIDRISGSGVFGRDPDSILNFTAHAEADCFTVDCVFRNYAPHKSFVVKWEWPVFVVQQNLDPLKLKQTKGRPAKFSVNDLVDLLREVARALTTKELRDLASEELGMSASSFKNFARQLRKAPQITHSAGGIWSFNGH